MRPLRLTMTAFGPYAGTEDVDFEALTGVGLFVVAGNNGAGKTTIFDALHYSLYGVLPGRRATYGRLKSDHADAKTECTVALDFVAHGTKWRVERAPAQTRAKRRGTGTTEAPAKATLFRYEQDGPVAVTNRLDEVRAKCAELVGLSGRQFERVALLPQGEFSRVLREKGTERRALLRTLFSSEVFDNATGLITDQASAATASGTSQREQLSERRRALALDLATVTACPVDPATDDLARLIDDYRRVELARRRTHVDALAQASMNAAQDLEAARGVARRIERRQQVREQQQLHERRRDNHDRDRARLAAAKAAVPVVSNARTVAQHEQRRDAASASAERLHRQLGDVLGAAGLALPAVLDEESIAALAEAATDLTDRLAARANTLSRCSDMASATARVQGELRRKANEIETLREQGRVAQSQLRQTATELERLETAAADQPDASHLRELQAQLAQRNELATLEGDHDRLVAEAVGADRLLSELAQTLHDTEKTAASAAGLEHKAEQALEALEHSEGRAKAFEQFRRNTSHLDTARADLQVASAHHDQLWQRFVNGTAARLAEHLADGESCPVCGSCEHPQPATDDDQVAVTEHTVRDERERVDSLREKVRSLETQIERLLGEHRDLATASAAELAAEISTAKAMALGARSNADEALRAAALVPSLSEQLAQSTHARADLDDRLRQADKRQLLLRGALGALADETAHRLQQQVDAVIQSQAAVAQLDKRRTELTALLATLEQNVETIGLGEIAAKSQHDSLVDQLNEHQMLSDELTAELATHDAGLMPSSAEHSLQAPELRAKAARQVQEFLAQVRTTAARQDEATEGLRRAQSILTDRLAASPFTYLDEAREAFMEPDVLEQIEAQTTAYAAADERLHGQLSELAGLPDSAPDLSALMAGAEREADAFASANESLIAQTTQLDRIGEQLATLAADQERFESADPSTRRLERVAALVKGDNDRNMSLENWVLAAHLRDVVDLANVRLARSTHQRFQLCVLDDGENRRGKWGLDLGVEDTVTGTQRPAAGLSGGELFQASLALALGLADAVMNQSSGVHIDALFIDEGFGSLDEQSVERAIDLLDELRDRGAMVGVITHVPALLDALPLGISVIDAPDGTGSTIRQQRLAA